MRMADCTVSKIGSSARFPAKLYALDATTGKELYSSGDQIGSFLHQAGIALAGGRVIFGTFDGTIYCFGLE